MQRNVIRKLIASRWWLIGGNTKISSDDQSRLLNLLCLAWWSKLNTYSELYSERPWKCHGSAAHIWCVTIIIFGSMYLTGWPDYPDLLCPRHQHQWHVLLFLSASPAHLRIAHGRIFSSIKKFHSKKVLNLIARVVEPTDTANKICPNSPVTVLFRQIGPFVLANCCFTEMGRSAVEFYWPLLSCGNGSGTMNISQMGDYV